MYIDASSIDIEALADDFIAGRIEIFCGYDDEAKRIVTQMLLDGGASHGSWASQEVIDGKHHHYTTVYCQDSTIEYHCSRDCYAKERINLDELISRYGTTPPRH